jgi:ribonuclease D
MGWAQEEFSNVMNVEPVHRTSPDAFRIHGSKGLDDRGRAVLQALLEWRETEAQRRDIPPFKVLSTASLLELGKAPSESVEKMLRVPGITHKVLRLWGDGILAAVKQGLCAPLVPRPYPRSETGRRRNPRNPRFRQRFLSLKTVRDNRAREMGLDPGVLCPNASLKALAGASRDEFPARMGEALKPWQREALEESFKTVLQ